MLAPALLHPQHLEGFTYALHGYRPSGVNPSILGLLDGLARWTSGDPDRAALWPVVVWAVLSGAIGWMSRGLLRDAASNRDDRILIFATAIVYALCVPRFMTYTGLLLLVPLLGFAWVFMKQGGNATWRWVALALLFCAPGLERVPPKELGALLSSSAPFFLTLGMWVALRRTDLRGFTF